MRPAAEGRVRAFGEAALLVELGGWQEAQSLAGELRSAARPEIEAVVPGLKSVLVEFAPSIDEGRVGDLMAELEAAAVERAATPPLAGRLRDIPVCYGGSFGPDLDEVARLTGLAADDVVARHVARALSVALLGFAPGFPYIVDLPAELEVARLATPRTTTPPGSVAVAGRMTGIYPAALPGGWRVIGRTPLVLFDARRDPPAYLAPGDRVRFRPIPAEQFEPLLGAARDWQ